MTDSIHIQNVKQLGENGGMGSKIQMFSNTCPII